MKRLVSLTGLAAGVALLTAPTASGAASYSLRFQRSNPHVSSFSVRRYQRPQLSHRTYTPLRSRESRTTSRKNYMPTNTQIRSGRTRHYRRPARTQLSRNPSNRIAGHKKYRVRRRVRWAANR